MTNEKPFYPKFSYDEHARNCAPDDFLGQTRRTIRGVAVSDDQIQMIIKAMSAGLDLGRNDTLLELACGNGVLSHFLFDSCKEYLGVDISEYLISVAKQNFETLPSYRFAVQGAIEYVRQEPQPERFSKVLCYAGFQYFSADEATEILKSIFEKFSNVQTVFIGSLPDKDQAAKFYKENQPSAKELSDCSTAIGFWRTRGEFAQIASNAGWKVKLVTMSDEFHASYYRFDALLSR